jgi:predicted adenylyl cyclase CyaB
VSPPDGALRANVELKARVARRDAVVETARRLGAADLGEEEQVDTYFSLGKERLKLRESSRGDHSLLRYSRPDRPGARKSQYRRVPVQDPGSFRGVLERQWGVRAVVRKRRHAFLWEGRVRIHADEVEGLGDFLEFEAMLDPERPEYDEGAAALEVARLAHDFGVREADLVATSYATLVLEAAGIPSGT